ncbi:MAG: AAA family ATPase, partial [Neisseriaceae bacterium]|nr:AAA family ATPase [Neisseriaceae bacterium]
MNTKHQATNFDLKQGFTVTIPQIPQIPRATDPFNLPLKAGVANIFIGANGSGKTRLSIFIEEQVVVEKRINTSRISANRSMVLNPTVKPLNKTELAHYKKHQCAKDLENIGIIAALGEEAVEHFESKKEFPSKSALQRAVKYKNYHPATGLLNNFDDLMSALYADQNQFNNDYRHQNITELNERCALEKIQKLWNTLLLACKLNLTEAGNLNVTSTKKGMDEMYSASEMSDGERVIFYLIASILIQEEPTVFIIDEPELHINPALMNDLWTEIEKARPDCCFVYVTHDMNFAQRHEAVKYAIFSYDKVNDKEQWQLSNIKKDDAILEELMLRIIGSRRPILLVEGKRDSLDCAVYSAVYDKFHVIYMEGCQNVISTVKSFNKKESNALHRVEIRGLIDGDGRTDEQKDKLKTDKIYCSPIAQIENLFLCEQVFKALASQNNKSNVDEAYKELLEKLGNKFQNKADLLTKSIAKIVKSEIEKIKYTQTEKANNEDMKNALTGYIEQLNNFNIDIDKRFNEIRAKLEKAIKNKKYDDFFELYQGKDCLSLLENILLFQSGKVQQKILDSLKSEENSE